MKKVRKTLNVDEVAQLLGIGRTLAYQAVRRGEIPSIRIGNRYLVPKAALEKVISEERRWGAEPGFNLAE